MATCYFTSGATKGCGFGFGGISNVWLGNQPQLSGVTSDASNQITGFTATLYEFEFVDDSASLTEALQRNGSSQYVNATLNFQLDKPTQAKINLLNELASAWAFAVIKASDGTYYMVGDTGRGLHAIDGTQLATGAAQADSYGITVVLEGATLGYANTVSEAAVLANL
jgi:hypothetical protein